MALWQARHIAAKLQRLYPRQQLVIKQIVTQGDRERGVPLRAIGGRGVFVKEIERALLAGEIDLAVHSLKDLPGQMSPELVLAAFDEREEPRDVLVTRWRCSLAELPSGARLGTSSARRQAQLLAFRRDFQIQDLRGNLDTRLRKALSGEVDGIVVAAAGMIRLDLQNQISQYLPLNICLPSVGQGALAIQIRAGNSELQEMLFPLDHQPTRSAITAERAFLAAMGGGCQVPIAAYGRVEGICLMLEGMVSSLDGRRMLRAREIGEASAPERVGSALAEQLLSLGGAEILRGGQGE
ncbi:MAG: hydroxymethylbilane synthase [Chloroflexi bacterium]|nr:hydroxymethylbilane synthase [Chloroflexota bacterium]MCL5075367.1 hydroxymethylbilane synthase [Chloroflexota bacterium]